MTTPEERNRKKYEVRLAKIASDPAYREAFLKKRREWILKKASDVDYKRRRAEQYKASKLRQKYGKQHQYIRRGIPSATLPNLNLKPFEISIVRQPLEITFD